MSQEAWEKVAEDEVSALAKLLATDGRRIMIVLVSAESAGVVRTFHAVEGETRTNHVRQFVAGFQSKADWLKSKLVRSV